MEFGYSNKTQALRERVDAFMQEHVYPVEAQVPRGSRREHSTRRPLDADHD